MAGKFFRTAGLLTATTLGAGIFALPYVFYKAGWLLGLFYLVILAGLMIVIHSLYWQTLVKVKEKNRLLGLAKEYLGKIGFNLAFAAIVGGLVLALVAYLLLGSQFLKLVFPDISSSLGILVFWLAGSMPLFLGLRRLVGLELLGGVFMIAIIFLIFVTALPLGDFSSVPSFDFNNIFLPFGVVLFSLAGWTAIEPIFDSEKREERVLSGGRWREFGIATLVVIVMYLVFVAAIFGSAAEITTNTVSGLTNWARWQLVILGLFGLFTLWTSYVPIGLEIKNLLGQDLNWPRFLNLGLVLFLPLVLIWAGLKNFLEVVGLVGGIFLAWQYFFLVIIGVKVLQATGLKKLGLYLISLVFLSGVVYEIYYFVR